MATSSNEQHSANSSNRDADDLVDHPHLRHIRELLADVGPILDQCRDSHGEVDWQEVAAQAQSLTDELEASLIDRMAPYDVFDILGNMLLYNLPIDTENYRASEHDGLIANVEYAAVLCLRRSDGTGLPEERHPAAVGQHMESWNSDIKRLLRIRGLGQMARLGQEDSELSRVRYEQFERELLVRNPSYEWQEQANLHGLLGSETLRADLERVVGFDVDTALRLANLCTDWIFEALARGANDAVDESHALRQLVAAQGAAVPGPALSENEARVVADLAERSDEELDEMLLGFQMWSAWNALGDRSTFTARELATAGEVDEEVAQRFLDVFSQSLGQDLSADPIRAIQAVRARPIIREGNRYQCVDGGSLLWAIRSRIEDAIKTDASAWNRYDRHRSTWTEQRSIEILAGVLRPNEQYHSLRWSTETGTYELDGLLLVDRHVITIEVKSGRFTESARRASPERLQKDLNALIAKAHEQARRARDALMAGTVFSDRQGNPVRIDPERFETVLPLVITLDELGVSPRVWQLARNGLLERGEQHPTTMALSELEVICEVLDTPSRLLHYLTRRQTFNQIGGVAALEEADLMMYYLDQGLYVEGDDRPGLLLLPSLTDPLDAYQYHKHGKRKAPAPKPSAQLHPLLVDLIERLEALRPGGWTATACLLLDLSGDEQDRLASHIASMRDDSLDQRIPHDITIAINGSTRGLTVVTEPDGDHEQLKEYVRTISFKNKHMTRALAWSGVGIHAEKAGSFHFHLYDATPWQPDEEVDEAIAAWTEVHERRSGPNTRNWPDLKRSPNS